MTTPPEETDAKPPEETDGLSPHEALDVVGDRTRLEILRTLGEAGRPLSFSDLFDRVDYEDSANFSYHLRKLTDHFVRKTEDGYALRRAGGRVVEAILSGAVTAAPVVDRTAVETPCFLCGGRMEVDYREETVRVYCRDCGGTRGGASATTGPTDDGADDIVGGVGLPPAGVRERTPTEMLGAAEVRSVARAQLIARNVCPRCSAPLRQSVRVCEDHDATEGRCGACDQRFAATLHVECSTCILDSESVLSERLLADPRLMRFMLDHDVDPLAPEGFHLAAMEETVRETAPFETEYTFTAGTDALTLRVDDDLNVTAVSTR